MLADFRCFVLFLGAVIIQGLDPNGVLASNINNDKRSPIDYGKREASSKHVYRTFNQFIYCDPVSPIQYPKTITELQALIKSAIASQTTVKLFGSRHSNTDIICTDGIPISSRFLNNITLNSDTTATIGPGLELGDALEALHALNRTLIHVPTFGGITIGGAIGTGAHGSSLRHHSSISDQLVAITLIDGKGDIRTITSEDGDDFRAIGVHLGLLGAIVEITVKTVPLFKMTVKNSPESDSSLEDGTAIAEARQYDLYQLWWFPSSNSVVVSKGNYSNDLSIPGNATSNFIASASAAEAQIGKQAFEAVQAARLRQGAYALEEFTRLSLHREVVGRPPFFEDGGAFVNPATGYGHRLLQNRCKPCAWQNGGGQPDVSAVAFETSELSKVVAKIKAILQKYPSAFPMMGIYIRFSKASNNLMAVEWGRETVHLEWISATRSDPYNCARDNVAAFQAILQAMVKDHNGRPHWGKNGPYYFTQAILKTRVPNLSKFTSIMKKFDPNGIFLNKFGRRLLLQSDDLTMDPKVTHCALQDYCVCSKDSDCATSQICNTQALNDDISVCQDVLSVLLPKPMMSYDPNNFSSIVDAINFLID